MPNPRFDKFYRYAELTRLLKAYAKEYPDLIRLQSIGKSFEGRDVWLVTATNFKSGKDAEKPALWVDANLHASEVTGSAAALYLIHALVTRYRKDADLTRALDTRAFYICPRVNPDGAEWALADRPKEIRSVTRPYPYNEDHMDGLVLGEDMDGDGRILQMRIVDPNGGWKVHPDEPRLMIRRDPIEVGGTYYRILPEGELKNYDGVTINIRRPREALDLNRNFPANWRTESEQRGAGDFPTSESEARNLVEFVMQHPNITGTISFHTMSGVLLRGFSDKPDIDQPTEDLWTYEKIGARGTELTGYPHISTFHEFKYYPKQVITGAFDEWTYEHRGLFSWTVEFWDPMKQAGIENYKYIEWYREHPLTDDLKLLQWNADALRGQGFVDWYAYDHPQLGRVELGGWDYLHMWTNVPLHLLEKEISPFPDWIVFHALISPRLALREAPSITSLSADTFRVRLVVQNEGWLPTYVTKKALERKVTRGVLAEIQLPKGARLIAGKEREELGELEGRAYKNATVDEANEGTHDLVKVEWVVKAKRGSKLKLLAKHERGGTVHVEVVLK